MVPGEHKSILKTSKVLNFSKRIRECQESMSVGNTPWLAYVNGLMGMVKPERPVMESTHVNRKDRKGGGIGTHPFSLGDTPGQLFKMDL